MTEIDLDAVGGFVTNFFSLKTVILGVILYLGYTVFKGSFNFKLPNLPTLPGQPAKNARDEMIENLAGLIKVAIDRKERKLAAALSQYLDQYIECDKCEEENNESKSK